jgi:hypothetical protein
MALLSGSASVSRFAVTARPDELVFEDVPFQAIIPGSTVRERIGFVPFELDSPRTRSANDGGPSGSASTC